MAMRGRRCAVEGCWRRSRSGRVVCKDHEETGLGQQMAKEVAKLEREVRGLLQAASPNEQQVAMKRFQQRVQRGDFAALFAGRMAALMEDEVGKEPLADEVGALRVAMMRLLTEGGAPVQVATALSRVTNATVRAMRAQEEMPDAMPTRVVLERAVDRLGEAARHLSPVERQRLDRASEARRTGKTKAEIDEWYSLYNQRAVLSETLQAHMKQQVREMQERMAAWERGEEFAGKSWEEADDAEENWPGAEERARVAAEPVDLTVLSGKALQDEMERLAWAEPGALRAALAKAAAKERSGGRH